MFSRYVTSFTCKRKLKEAYEQIELLAHDKISIGGFSFTIETASFDKVAAKVILNTKPLTKSNSFVPFISISIWEDGDSIVFQIEFEIRQGISFFTGISSLLCLVFVIIMLSIGSDDDVSPLLFFIPIIIMITIHGSSSSAYDSAVKELSSGLYAFFTNDDAESAPELIKVR